MNKDIREINIDTASKIGEGASGEVYRIADDTIVKIYRPGISLDAIKREKELCITACVKDITAMYRKY